MNQTFALYRILGNDLPPRHGTRHVIESLRFILDNEAEFPGCAKRWVLNRIADPDQEAEVIALLEERKQVYRRIPFDLGEYARCFLDADGLPPGFNALGVAAGNTPTGAEVLAYEWIFRRKNLYAININAARNFAVADGIAGGATWVMPWDGQCFLTPDGFAALRAAIEANPDARYIATPLHRVPDNRQLLEPGLQPGAEDEPQVTFRRDARDRFDVLLRYGRGNKAEFLDRIGGTQQWYKPTEWEPARQNGAHDRGRMVVAGAVFRLAAAAAERTEIKDNAQRWFSRFVGVATHCAELDARLVQAARARQPLLCYAPLLAAARVGAATRLAVARSAEELSAAAALPAAVTMDVFGAVAAMAIAAEVTGETRYADRAAALLRNWFVSKLRLQGGGQRSIVEMHIAWPFADALHLLQRAGKLTAEDVVVARSWFRATREQILKGDGAFTNGNHAGVFHDLLTVVVATACDDMKLMTGVLSRAPLRIHRQVQPWGWQQGETGNAAPLHRGLLGLQGLIGLAWLGRNCGIDLWRYAGINHRSIPMAARFIAQNRAVFSDYAADRARFDARIELALRAIPADAADAEAIADLPRGPVADIGELGAAEGFAPLWPVLLATDAENAGFANVRGQPAA